MSGQGANGARDLLLVEDNLGDADYIMALLEETEDIPDRVVHVENIADATAALGKQPMDAVLLDLRLPDATGIDAVRALRSVAGDVPIVVLTGIEDEALALTCINAGAQDYLSKQNVEGQHLRRALGYAMARVEETAARKHVDRLESLLAAIVGSSTDAIFSTTVDGVVVSWNAASERVFKVPRDRAVSRSLAEIAGETPVSEGLLEIDALLNRAAVDPSPVADSVKIPTDDGTMALSVLVSPVWNSSFAIVGRAVTCRDITELERRGDELARRNEKLIRHDQQMRALTARLHAIREDEQTRISREVHDQLGQMLTAIRMDLRWIERKLAGEGEPVTEAQIAARSQATGRLVDITVEAVQRIALQLRPSALDALGLAAAVRDEARRFARRSQLVVDVRIDDEVRAEPSVDTSLYRILQELLTNIARHAEASNVVVEIRARDGGLVLSVRDDGVGIDEEVAASSQALGLLSIRERAAAFGGSARFTKLEAGGTEATVWAPVEGGTRCATSL